MVSTRIVAGAAPNLTRRQSTAVNSRAVALQVVRARVAVSAGDGLDHARPFRASNSRYQAVKSPGCPGAGTDESLRGGRHRRQRQVPVAAEIPLAATAAH